MDIVGHWRAMTITVVLVSSVSFGDVLLFKRLCFFTQTKAEYWIVTKGSLPISEPGIVLDSPSPHQPCSNQAVFGHTDLIE